MSEEYYKQKYLKYKAKYLELKELIGAGKNFEFENKNEAIIFTNQGKASEFSLNQTITKDEVKNKLHEVGFVIYDGSNLVTKIKSPTQKSASVGLVTQIKDKRTSCSYNRTDEECCNKGKRRESFVFNFTGTQQYAQNVKSQQPQKFSINNNEHINTIKQICGLHTAIRVSINGNNITIRSIQ